MTMRSPSEIDVFDTANLHNPYPMYRALRERAPVHRIPGTDFYLVSSWEAVTDAVARTSEFSSHLTGVLVQQSAGPPLTFDMDGGGQAVHVLATANANIHTLHRKLVGPALAKRIRTLGPTVHELVARLWSEELHGNRIDWASGMADRLPLALVADVIGLPAADVPRLLAWAYDSTEMLGGVVPADRLPRLVASAAELAAYLHERFTEAKAAAIQPRSDTLLTVLVRACDAGELTDDVAVLILVQLVGAGGESTAGLIANAARLLATTPELQQSLRDHPTLLGAFLDEALRLESPFRSHHRHVVSDTTLAGVDLPAGAHLLLLWGAANRDPAIYPDPDEVQLERPYGRAHLAFGKGVHFCVGSALAKLEAIAALTRLLERSTRFDLADDSPPQWVPSLFVRRHHTLPLHIH
uniref:cytochrome P450 n=1 Tax=Nocardia brevicatena TaxID=37327 RepID=UPI0005939DA5